MASGKQSFREHCATKWLLEANPRNISASKISRYTVDDISHNFTELSHGDKVLLFLVNGIIYYVRSTITHILGNLNRYQTIF